MKRDSGEFDAFTKTVDRLLSVSKEEILRREEEYRQRAMLNPRKRGPKRKVKPLVSPDRAV
jgi:hypothetical protein